MRLAQLQAGSRRSAGTSASPWVKRAIARTPPALTDPSPAFQAPAVAGWLDVAMTGLLSFSASIWVAADPQSVYAVISDVTRTGEWSPVCQECWWDPGQGPQVGAHFTGRNVNAERSWETRSQVLAADPGRSFAWSVAEGVALWSYELDAEAGGTRLTETWVFPTAGQVRFVERYGEAAAAEIARRQQAAEEGIPITLTAIKSVIEARVSPPNPAGQ